MKPIPNFPGYFATKGGRIYSGPRKYHPIGIFLAPSVDKNGYYRIVMCREKKVYYKQVHRLILETFIGPCPEGMECCHGNGVRNDNRLENIRWDTVANNHYDKIKLGTTAKGSKCGMAKLNELQVGVIKRLLGFGILVQREIAELFDINVTAISDINVGNTWRHVKVENGER